MSKVCSITGSKVTRGSVIHRRGMAKKKGGVGRHVTKNVPRTFSPNLHEHRVWIPELKKFMRIKVTARAMKTLNKNGAYATLKKAAAIANYAGKRLDDRRYELIVQACDEILAGQHQDMFPLHVWMTGSGTQFNMNVNEVISNR